MDIHNINLGGIADSAYQWVAHSVAEAKNLDIHSEPWIIRINQGMKLDTVLPSLAVAIVPCSDGKIYLFLENGKIYEKHNGYRQVADSGSRIMDAVEFEGYIYYTHKNYLARWKIGNSWTSREETFGQFLKKDTDYHPLYALNMVLYVWDGHYVAQVEDNIFVPDALDLEVWQRIRSLGQVGYNLAIWTYVNDNINQTQIYRWNTWSKSWTLSDRVPEVGINAFLDVDNAILVQAGEQGNIYAYNGSQLERYKRIPWDWLNNKAIIRNNATTTLQWIPLFGISNKLGNPVDQWVYSYGSYASNFPAILNHEYSLSCGVHNVEIWALKVIDWLLYASWRVGNNCGVDVRDFLKKADKGTLVSMVLDPRRKDLKINHIDVCYRSLPNNCNIKVYIRENNTAWRELETTNDRIRHIVRSKSVKFGAFSQVKVELHTHQNNTPEITSIRIP